MSEIFQRIVSLVVQRDEVQISDHGYDEMVEDEIYARDVISGIGAGMAVLITAYRPDPDRWMDNFRRRKT